MDWLSWIIVLALVGFILYSKFADRKNEPKQDQDISTNDYSGCYQKKLLFTKNEYYGAKKLYKYADERGLIICPKVRLLDIIEPIKGERYQALMGKIKLKHVDFVVCGSDLRILGVVELDDNSHDRKDRQQRDAFVDSILQDVGYKVVRTRGITETTLDAFSEKKPVAVIPEE